ncbi:GNAT family N-acetyltransferase [Adhaeribacter pallidiroseus]|uniref:Ribosomal-protein-alanine N-acetyltransferase n=1 Tax=Adhaeribacter pallidiroseus TaxID=2072847 RepID=A0A369QNL3_9BACT|nr:GNAT family N-acetyltransferase [Adhaeribacter pallidiroseus]RDC64449.1 Ribosomal-protein-alanine N-acetyltransferase [Adhaeribacter pallidiroseus]
MLIQTNRLILRELLLTDEEGIFALDSDPEVQIYLGNKPITRREQARQTIAMIQQQYVDNGIGRWAVLEKETNEFMGWAGLKLIKETINKHTNYYDLGYRFLPKYWGQGYATQAARASLNYGFTKLHPKEIFAMTDTRNLAFRKILEKVGFRCLNTFDYAGTPHYWFRIIA